MRVSEIRRHYPREIHFATTKESDLRAAAERVLPKPHREEPLARGNPESPLRRRVKSTRALAKKLENKGFKVEKSAVKIPLDESGHSLRANRKRLEGTNRPDGNARFERIDDKIQSFVSREIPVVSVDAETKENIDRATNRSTAPPEFRSSSSSLQPRIFSLHVRGGFSSREIVEILMSGIPNRPVVDRRTSRHYRLRRLFPASSLSRYV